MILWERCKEDFRNDGSLRDIYVKEATLDDWRTFYPILSDRTDVEYFEDGIVRPPPADIGQVFEARQATSPMLRFRVGNALVVFHFFTVEEIECDFRPSEIASQVDLDALLVFVRLLGDTTRKRAVVTPENDPSLPFIDYDPVTREFEYRGISAS